MEFNKSKCYVLRMSHKKQSIGTCYYLQDTPLEMSAKQKYLGVDLSNSLDWSHHINSITSTDFWLTVPQPEIMFTLYREHFL